PGGPNLGNLRVRRRWARGRGLAREKPARRRGKDPVSHAKPAMATIDRALQTKRKMARTIRTFVPSEVDNSRSNSGLIALPPLPFSGARTSLRPSSPQKREFLRFELEIFGRFSPKLPVLGFLETGAICENRRKMQVFRV